MDLEKYKQVWKNQPEESKILSGSYIYELTKKKSSSVAKWIFIIGMIEILIWLTFNFFCFTDKIEDILKLYNIKRLVLTFSCIHYFITLVFLISFFINQKSIAVTDNTKKLLTKIKKTRNTVKYYVYFNISSYIIGSITFYTIILKDPEKFASLLKKPIQTDHKTLTLIFFCAETIIILVVGFTLWLIYKLVYGRLINKLNSNYKELTKLDE